MRGGKPPRAPPAEGSSPWVSTNVTSLTTGRKPWISISTGAHTETLHHLAIGQHERDLLFAGKGAQPVAPSSGQNQPRGAGVDQHPTLHELARVREIGDFGLRDDASHFELRSNVRQQAHLVQLAVREARRQGRRSVRLAVQNDVLAGA